MKAGLERRACKAGVVVCHFSCLSTVCGCGSLADGLHRRRPHTRPPSLALVEALEPPLVLLLEHAEQPPELRRREVVVGLVQPARRLGGQRRPLDSEAPRGVRRRELAAAQLRGLDEEGVLPLPALPRAAVERTQRRRTAAEGAG